MLKKKTEQLNLDVTIDYSSIEEVPMDADLVVVNPHLLLRVQSMLPYAEIWSIPSFVEEELYEKLGARLTTTSNNERN